MQRSCRISAGAAGRIFAMQGERKITARTPVPAQTSLTASAASLIRSGSARYDAFRSRRPQKLFNADLFRSLPHHCNAGSRMRLVPRHCGGSIIKYDQNEIRSVIKRIDYARNTGGKKRGVPNKGEMQNVRLRNLQALRHRHAGSHAKAGVHHVQGARISKRIAADIAAVYGAAAQFLYGPFHRIKGAAVRTAGAKHRRTNRKLR